MAIAPVAHGTRVTYDKSHALLQQGFLSPSQNGKGHGTRSCLITTGIPGTLLWKFLGSPGTI